MPDSEAPHPANFRDAPFPEPVDLPAEAIAGPKRFYNRELSWLGFNWRVLEESENPNVPLLERVRMLPISASNLDEFYTVRVAGLRQLAHARNAAPSFDGLTPAEQLTLVNAEARRLMERQQQVWESLRGALETEGIILLAADSVTKEDRKLLGDIFLDRVFPVLSPLAIDPAHPFPFIPNSGFVLGLQLERRSDGRRLQALLPIPSQVDRFVRLPDAAGKMRYLPLEELLVLHIGNLFPGYRTVGRCAFAVLRDSDIEVEEEAEDLVREFEVALKRRRRGDVIRLKLTADAPSALREVIMERLNVHPDEEVVELDGLIGIADVEKLVTDERPDLLWPPFAPRVPVRVAVP